jgi:hypothetical protein
MTPAERYKKFVEWSAADQTFVGQCPGVIGPCCHGEKQEAVYRELCEIVDEWIELTEQPGKPLPPLIEGNLDAG